MDQCSLSGHRKMLLILPGLLSFICLTDGVILFVLVLRVIELKFKCLLNHRLTYTSITTHLTHVHQTIYAINTTCFIYIHTWGGSYLNMRIVKV